MSDETVTIPKAEYDEEVEAIRKQHASGYWADPCDAAELAIGKLLSRLDRSAQDCALLREQLDTLQCRSDMIVDAENRRLAAEKGEQEALSALDQAQREIQRLSRIADDRAGFLTELREAWVRERETHAAEIARLSSPPPERAEIVERQRLGWPQPLPCHAQAAADISALLGDCAAWRNAHALVTRERDEARGKCARLEQQQLGAKALFERIERLEAALEWLKDSGVFSVSLSQQYIYGNSGSCDIPADLADIIKPTTGASNG